KTTTVSVLNPPSPTITPIQPVCSRDAAIQLSVTPNTGQWTNSSFMSTSGLFTPSNAAVGPNIAQYVIGTQNCNRSDLTTIIVEAFVSAEITQSLPDLCNTSPAINLAPFTSAGNGVWSGPG